MRTRYLAAVAAVAFLCSCIPQREGTAQTPSSASVAAPTQSPDCVAGLAPIYQMTDKAACASGDLTFTKDKKQVLAKAGANYQVTHVCIPAGLVQKMNTEFELFETFMKARNLDPDKYRSQLCKSGS